MMQNINPFNKIRGYKIILPILLGLAVVFWLMRKDLNLDRIRVAPLNFKTEGSKWCEIVYNKGYDTALVTIDKEFILNPDSISFEIEYFIKNNGTVIDYNQHITFKNTTTNLSIPDKLITNIERLSIDAFTISFAKPLVEPFSIIEITRHSIFFLAFAILLMIFRDFGYMLRIRILSDNKYTWYQAFKIIMLWEFTSAVTPSAVGGTSLAVIFLNKEGLSIGRSTSVVLATSFLDELYFIIMFPLLLLVIDTDVLFSLGGGFNLANKFLLIALGGYTIKLLYNIALGYGLFINPRGLKWLLLQIFRLPILRKWKHGANSAGDEIIISSRELVSKPFKFWIKAFCATFLSWTSRYWVVNAIFLAFFAVNDHFLLFARQLVMWIMMLVSPTPGGSGFSEFLFSEYLADFLPYKNIAGLLALFWRFATYYTYLIIGIFLVPRWVKTKIHIHLTHQPKKVTDKI